MNNSPEFDIVVPTYNRREIVIELLRCLSTAVTPQAFKVIVVCDGCTDGTAEAVNQWADRLNISVLEQPNSGSAAARNQGASAGDSPLIIFLDDDMRPVRELCSAYSSAFQDHPEIDLAVGRIGHDEKSPETILAGYVREWVVDLHNDLMRHGIRDLFDIHSGNICVSRTCFESLNGFNEEFNKEGRYGNEDMDFGRRVLDRGYKAKYVPKAQSDQYYAVKAKVKFRQARQLAVADTMFSEVSQQGREAMEDRMNTIGKVHVGWLDWLSHRFPRIVYWLYWPAKLIVCRAIDTCRRGLRVHYGFGLTQALAYRAGLADARRIYDK